MSLEKVLHKIQGQIHELAPTLEIFVDDTIQPSVSDCENLQRQLNLLQESIAVYKYDKLNKELSPSFNIHAKISAVEKPVEKAPEPTPHVTEKIEEPVKPAAVEHKHEEIRYEESHHAAPAKTETGRHKASLAIGLNDKFRFINMLFSQNASEYNIAIEQLGNMTSWHDTEIYLNSLRSLYDWKETNDVVKHFYSIAKKQFN